SVAMKTVGVLQLMMQFGLHIPADEGAKMKFFKTILADIGDDQSIEDDLSTYSSHLVKMTEFVKVANKDTLFLIDEMGSGTDPALGGPIAEAILDHLGKQKTYGIVTTHYSNLKDKAQVTEGLQNAAMSFEMKKLQPTYELHIGQAGASYAFEVAQRSGLPATILEAAKTLLGNKKSTAEQSLSQIQNEKQYLKGIRKNNQRQSEHLEKLIANYEGLKSRLEKQKKKLMVEFEEKLLADYNEANRELENYIRTQKEKGRDREGLKSLRKDIDDKRQALAKKINKADRKPIQENKSPIKVGSEVKLEDSPRIGKVIEIRKNKATVLFGNISSTIPIDRLIHCVNDDQSETPITNKSPNKLVEKSQFVDVLDIRGKYKEEALIALDQFMDQAVVFGVDKVKIIHGKGSGVLKDFVQQYLKDYPFVSRYEYETDPSGGKGVTLVEIA
ncbi:MAG: Smr/MutS family protein, partial [Bacteroidetes bacterium]|nr:Smr/MutS family protein [Bacteroidota bacterium]